MFQPLISIIVPCYNQAQYLDECLQSVLDQTCQNWECIIVNDGSPDNTGEVAEKWVQKDSRFKYFRKENGGLSSARNFGIVKALAEWILPLDADDKIGSNYLDLASERFAENFAIIYCDAEYFGSRTGRWELKDFDIRRFAVENLIFCSAFFPKKYWNDLGGYDENLKNGYEDWDFWIRIISNDIKVLKLDKTCFFYRIKDESMTINLQQKKEIINQTLFYLYQKHSEFFSKHLPNIQQTIIRSEITEEKLFELSAIYHKMTGSKRFKIINNLFSIFDNKKKQIVK